MTSSILMLCYFIALSCFVQLNFANGNCTAKYTKQEKGAIEALRKEVSPYLSLDYQSEDGYLFRWIQYNKMNVKLAADSLKKSVQWRKENGVDEILTNKDVLKLVKNYPTVFGRAIDKFGHPTSEVIISQWDVRRALISGKLDSMVQIYTHSFEKMSALSRKLGMNQFNSLVNLQGYNRRTHGCFACIPMYAEVTTLLDRHYPNIIHRFVAINAPSIYDALLNILRPAMSDNIRNVSYTFGPNKNDWQPFLLDLYEKNQLPAAFGGTRLN